MSSIPRSADTLKSKRHSGMKTMSATSKRGWKWAYRKMRDLHCDRPSAFYRATLYVIRGDTGAFHNDVSWQKIRIRR